MAVDFDVFNRLATRCSEVVTEAGASPVLVSVYQKSSEQPLTRFADAHTAVERGEVRENKARNNLDKTLEEMDPLFRMARSAVAAVLPEEVLPDTLKMQPTDTDKRNAISKLLGIISKHGGEAWADTLLQGDFGQKAPIAEQQLNEAIEASNAVQKARSDRAAAFDPAWGAFLKFKRLVRDTYGATSKQYRRLRLRTSAAAVSEDVPPEAGEEESDAPDAPESEAAPSVG